MTINPRGAELGLIKVLIGFMGSHLTLKLYLQHVLEKRLLRVRDIIWSIDSDFWTQHSI